MMWSDSGSARELHHPGDLVRLAEPPTGIRATILSITAAGTADVTSVVMNPA